MCKYGPRPLKKKSAFKQRFTPYGYQRCQELPFWGLCPSHVMGRVVSSQDELKQILNKV